VRTVWLGLGTNLGDRAANLGAAIGALDRVVTVDALSSVYETAPFGHADQPLFWNMAVHARTAHRPLALLRVLKPLETALGRVPSFHMGPRLIDIDILLCDDVVLDSPELTLPHAGLCERPFVLVPLLELDPSLRDPRTGARLADCAAASDRTGLRRVGTAADVLAPATGARHES
jgi:2-amino-4-hydroxy-6-hydroxymethyldihydropteridine diphosphokinase